MSMVEIPVGRSRWTFDVPEGRLTRLPLRATGAAIADPREAVRDALDHPLHFDVPLRRAMIPDDHIALVIDERLPRLAELVAGVLEYLLSAGIGPDSVTIVTAPGAGPTSWIDELPDEFADVRTEVHHPDDRKQLSYLAATKKGRRVYLNRTLVDADQVICISGRRYDPQLGYAGGEGILYPAFSDQEVRRALSGRLSMAVPARQPEGVRAEAVEIARLLGSAIFIQVIEANGDEIAHVHAGLLDVSADGDRLLDERWRFPITEKVDVVVASLSGDPARHDFNSLGQAAAAASRAVKANGAIVLLSEAEPELGEGMELLRRCEDPVQALKLLNEHKPADQSAAFQWASVAAEAHIYFASGLRPDLVEELFATPLLSPGEVQRLLDGAGSCLLLPDADKCLVVVEDTER